MVNELPDGHHFSRWLGIEVHVTEPGCSVGVLRERPEILNIRSVLHGGVLTTLADVTMANALRGSSPEGFISVTTSLHITFLKPGRGTVQSRGRAIRSGKRSGYAEVDIVDADGDLVAHAVGHFTYLPIGSPRLHREASQENGTSPA
jgi:uncharacterized protein (TIGR00369 family)